MLPQLKKMSRQKLKRNVTDPTDEHWHEPGARARRRGGEGRLPGPLAVLGRTAARRRGRRPHLHPRPRAGQGARDAAILHDGRH